MTNSRGGALVCGITEDITERKVREERRMEEAVRQRDALVSEVHHRVKNSLQGVVGLLRRHERRSHSPSPSLEMALTQLQSVAIVHGLQGQGSAAGVILQKMLDEMTQMHGRLSVRRVDLKVEEYSRDAIHLAEADATAVALVLNELIGNAVKHSALEQEDAAVVVQVEGGPQHVRVRVRNPGHLPQGFDQSRGKRIGTGLRLVQTLAPREGMRIAFSQDGEVVEVTIEMSAPVLVLSSCRESHWEGKHAGNRRAQ
jgi:two-component sensor histidine kinase